MTDAFRRGSSNRNRKNRLLHLTTFVAGAVLGMLVQRMLNGSEGSLMWQQAQQQLGQQQQQSTAEDGQGSISSMLSDAAGAPQNEVAAAAAKHAAAAAAGVPAAADNVVTDDDGNESVEVMDAEPQQILNEKPSMDMAIVVLSGTRPEDADRRQLIRDVYGRYGGGVALRGPTGFRRVYRFKVS